MRGIASIFLIWLCPVLASAQDPEIGFAFGRTTYAELDAKSYPADSTAEAYVINEFGNATVNLETNQTIVFSYHVKIKILKASAVERGDIQVLLRQGSGEKETIREVRASSFNHANNRIQESKMESRVFIEKNENYHVAKFAIPNVQVGSVIEYQYVLETTYFWNFIKWEFQTDIPKVRSEYVTTIPANYQYNIALRGYLGLTYRDEDLIPKCISDGTGAHADCAKNTYVIEKIPAFKEEEFMTAKENFISSINFELAEVRGWTGSVSKYTREWKDVDRELDEDQKFGKQLRRGKDIIDGHIDIVAMGETDPLAKGKKVFDFVKFWYSWDGKYSYRSEFGIKKAFDSKTGNVGDINLTLIAALRYAGIKADPVLLATRHIERPTELYPVLSDFNYVIAKVVIGDKEYLLDAVDDFMPFGSIPRRCYNGKGRVMNEKESYWMEIKPTDTDRIVSQMTLKLQDDGSVTGQYTRTYSGYAGVDKRIQFNQHSSEQEYLSKLKANSHVYEITGYQRTIDEDDFSKPVTEKFEIQFTPDQLAGGQFLFNPNLLTGQENSNPFKTETRQFPVDYGVPIDRNLILMFEYPESYEVVSLPEKLGIALPNAGGRCIYGAQADGKKLTINMRTSISKPVFAAEEYPFLRELYARQLQATNTDIIFKKKQ